MIGAMMWVDCGDVIQAVEKYEEEVKVSRKDYKKRAEECKAILIAAAKEEKWLWCIPKRFKKMSDDSIWDYLNNGEYPHTFNRSHSIWMYRDYINDWGFKYADSLKEARHIKKMAEKSDGTIMISNRLV